MAETDRMAEIRARLDAWNSREFGGSISDALDRAALWTETAAIDIAYLLAEVQTWQERAERQNPIIELRDDGSIWVRVDGLA